jgi:hypothetical protein
MQTLGSAPEALSQDDIIRQYSKSLEECITAASDPQNDFERQILINQARLNVMFVKGQHFNVPGQVDTPWGQMADYVPFDSSTGRRKRGRRSAVPADQLRRRRLLQIHGGDGQHGPESQGRCRRSARPAQYRPGAQRRCEHSRPVE